MINGIQKFDLAGMVVFGLLGIVALIDAVFCKATHHLFTAGVCAVMVLVLYVDYKREKKHKN